MRHSLPITLALSLVATDAYAQAQDQTLTVLTVNLQGTIESYGGANVPWRTRYGRIAPWIQQNSDQMSGRRAPDLMVLQEVYSYEGCPAQLSGRYLPDYEALATLIGYIEAKTTVRYRIAYYGVQGHCLGWAGRALLYNSGYLTNITVPTQIVWPYDNEQVGIHLRGSHPCRNPAPGLLNPCGLIDGNGVGIFWTSAYHRPVDGRWRLGPMFTRLQLKNRTDIKVHVYNAHIDFGNCGQPADPACAKASYNAAYLATNSLVDVMEARFTDKSRYPPILAGDFNTTLTDGTLPVFPRFGVAAYAPDRDVMGILIGRIGSFGSRFHTYRKAIAAPRPGEPNCGDHLTLWSDHCAVFARFSLLTDSMAVQARGMPEVYYIASGAKFHFPNEQELVAKFGFPWSEVRPLGIEDVMAIPDVPKDRALVRELGQDSVFLIAGGARIHVPGPEFGAMGLQWRDVWKLPAGSLGKISTIPRDHTLLKERSNPAIYVMDKGRKRHIRTYTAFVKFGYDAAAVHQVPRGGLALIPNGPQVDPPQCDQLRADFNAELEQYDGLDQKVRAQMRAATISRYEARARELTCYLF
jgi:hypothetical protein